MTAIVRQGGGRVGFTVSKKVGNAVVRNAVKRRLREIARHHQELWRFRDLVLVAKPEAAGRSLAELAADVLATLHKLDEGGARPRGRTRDKAREETPR